LASLPPSRCSCGRWLRRRAEGHDDWEAEERGYFHEFEECPCGGDVRTVTSGPEPTRAPRQQRARSTATRQRARMHKHTCDCQPARIVRAATTDLTDVTCGRCGSWFVWQPTESELSDNELAGRVPA